MATFVRRLWDASPPLTVVGLLMLALTPLSGAAMLLDPREILGVPAWLKPAKFAVSTGIFCLTMAWILAYLPVWRFRRVVGWITALVFVIEVGIIDLQAWRGTTSHFNVGTTLDGILFSIMGTLILLQTVMTVFVAVALWRTRFDTAPALGWGLRLGLTLSILGAATGGLMTRPTADQLAAAQAGQRMTVAGAHTVGAPDGGPGLPGTGWSTEHGDLRVPHFVGLHAVQVIPLVAIVLARRRFDAARQVRLVFAAAAGYAFLFGILLWQALQGQPLVAL